MNTGESGQNIIEFYNQVYASQKGALRFDGFDFENDGTREKFKGDMREGFVVSMLSKLLPEYTYELTTTEIDENFSVDIIVSDQHGAILGMDVKGAGFFRMVNSDPSEMDRYEKRLGRQSLFGLPVLTLAIDLNCYGFTEILDMRDNSRSSVNISQLVRNSLLRNEIHKKNTSQLNRNREQLTYIIENAEDPNVVRFFSEMRNMLIPQRLLSRAA